MKNKKPLLSMKRTENHPETSFKSDHFLLSFSSHLLAQFKQIRHEENKGED